MPAAYEWLSLGQVSKPQQPRKRPHEARTETAAPIAHLEPYSGEQPSKWNQHGEPPPLRCTSWMMSEARFQLPIPSCAQTPSSSVKMIGLGFCL